MIYCNGNIFDTNNFLIESNGGLNKVNKTEMNCCIEYDINWNEKSYKEMFCSTIPNQQKCKIEINFFKEK